MTLPVLDLSLFERNVDRRIKHVNSISLSERERELESEKG